MKYGLVKKDETLYVVGITPAARVGYIARSAENKPLEVLPLTPALQTEFETLVVEKTQKSLKELL